MIAASVLNANFLCLEKEIKLLEEAGIGMLHLDVMDGNFVPNISFGSMIVKQIRSITSLPLDVHLMVENPERHIESFIKCDIDYLTFHIEATKHLNRLVSLVKNAGIKMGISINPATPLVFLDEVISEVDLVLIMSVNPGFGGQVFIDSSIQKIKKLKDKITEVRSNALIEVDGGVNAFNARGIREAGADILVVGSYILGSDSYKKAVKSIEDSLF